MCSLVPHNLMCAQSRRGKHCFFPCMQPCLLAQVLEFPVAMLVRFWVNHHLL